MIDSCQMILTTVLVSPCKYLAKYWHFLTKYYFELQFFGPNFFLKNQIAKILEDMEMRGWHRGGMGSLLFRLNAFKRKNVDFQNFHFPLLELCCSHSLPWGSKLESAERRLFLFLSSYLMSILAFPCDLRWLRSRALQTFLFLDPIWV